MPTSNLDKQGRIPEESLMGVQSSDDEQEQSQVITKNVNPYRRGRRSYDTLGGEWERVSLCLNVLTQWCVDPTKNTQRPG